MRSAHWHAVFVAASTVVAAVSAAPAGQRFTARVDVVRVDVLVTERGAPVRGLQAGDFEVRDNDVLQQIDLVDPDAASVNAILALDLSQSVVGEQLVHLRRAGHALVDALKPTDQAALIGFSHLIVLGSTLTRDLDRVHDALNRTTAIGMTSVADACFTSLILSESDPGRALVLVFSDGVDTASWLSTDAVLDIAKRSDAVVYGISATSAASGPKSTFLQDLSSATGGSLLEISSTRDLSRDFLSVLEEFRQRYLLSYTPRGVSREGYHRLSVKVKGRDVKVKARPGYLAR